MDEKADRKVSADDARAPADASQELNLTAHRAAGESVWDRGRLTGRREPALTRCLIGIGGAGLVIQGVRRRGFAGSLYVGLGGWVVWWAVTGGRELSDAIGRLGRVMERIPWRRADLVMEASDESFPASDAPAFTSTVGTGVRPKSRHAE